MSQYASTDDFAQLGLPERATRNIEAAVIDRFLTVASTLADRKLSQGGYATPLVGTVGPPNTYNAEIVAAVCCIARWRFLVWRGFAPDEFDESYKIAYDECMAWLNAIAAGDEAIDLPIAVDPVVPPGAIPKISTDARRGWLDEQREADEAAEELVS